MPTTPKKARFRLTMDKKCLMEARIEAIGPELDISTQMRTGPEMERFVIDALLGILWNIVPEDNIRLRALVYTGMLMRGVMDGNSTVKHPEWDPPVDEHEEDDIPL